MPTGDTGDGLEKHSREYVKDFARIRGAPWIGATHPALRPHVVQSHLQARDRTLTNLAPVPV